MNVEGDDGVLMVKVFTFTSIVRSAAPQDDGETTTWLPR